MAAEWLQGLEVGSGACAPRPCALTCDFPSGPESLPWAEVEVGGGGRDVSKIGGARRCERGDHAQAPGARLTAAGRAGRQDAEA